MATSVDHRLAFDDIFVVCEPLSLFCFCGLDGSCAVSVWSVSLLVLPHFDWIISLGEAYESRCVSGTWQPNSFNGATLHSPSDLIFSHQSFTTVG